MSQVRIATAIGIAPSTLHLYYFPEIRGRSGGIGRRQHEPTFASRAIVRQLAAEGLSRPQIAAAVGISVPTLGKHYRPELSSRSQCSQPTTGQIPKASK